METLVGVEGNEEGKFKESGIEKSNSSISSPKLGADPVVYKLVRVEGDGRLVPATDDELMEVGNLLADDKVEMHLVADTGQTEGFNCNERSSSGMPQLESSEGLSQSEMAEVEVGKSDTRIEYIKEILQKAKQEENHLLACGSPDHSSAYVLVDGQCSDQHDTLPGIDGKIQSEIPLQENDLSSVPSLNKTPISQSINVEECSHLLAGPIEGQPSTSVVCSSSKPDFSRLKGEICLDNLSIKELHETFKATFGRETTVKDKQWLKRRITMGLTNSCDVSTSSFIIKDNKLVSESNEKSCNNESPTSTKDLSVVPVNGGHQNSSINHGSPLESQQFVSGEKLRNCSIDHDSQSEDLHKEQRSTKRIRKPTRRYIEELSEVESKEHSEKSTISAKTSGLRQMSSKSNVRPVSIDSFNRTVRLDSLGGSGVQVPYVSRVRRSRPRKNVMALMEFHPCGISMAPTLVEKALGVHNAQPNSESGDIILKARSAPEQIQQRFIGEPENDKHDKRFSSMISIDQAQNMELEHIDPSGDTSDDNIVTVPTVKGGVRRKHHRAWTLAEVTKLVEGVSRYGAGRWSEIKRLAFASYSYRTSVDLKDKWRNLLKASLAQTPPDKRMGSRKHASSVPIPVPILLRVRELAQMHSQVPPNLSSSRVAGSSGRNIVNETRSGYL